MVFFNFFYQIRQNDAFLIFAFLIEIRIRKKLLEDGNDRTENDGMTENRFQPKTFVIIVNVDVDVRR
jgi:hypothetical protein